MTHGFKRGDTIATGGYQTPTITQQDLQGLGICSSPSGLFGGFRRLVYNLWPFMATDHGQTMMNIDESWNHGISIMVTGCNRYRQPSFLFPGLLLVVLLLFFRTGLLHFESHGAGATRAPWQCPAGAAQRHRWEDPPGPPGRAVRSESARCGRAKPGGGGSARKGYGHGYHGKKKQKIVEIMGQVKWEEDGGPSWILDLGLKDDGRLSFNFFATWAQVGAKRTQVDPGQVQEVEWHVAAEDLCTCSQSRNVSGCLVILHL